MTIALDKNLTRAAEKHLAKVDPVMKGLIKTYGPCSLASRNYRPFNTLVEVIISQQLSAKAAKTIKDRIVKIAGDPFRPSQFLEARNDELRAAGLSGAKLRYIKEVAGRVEDGRLSFDSFKAEESESVISTLIEIPGVGRWSAEMFLIFALKRPDVLAVHDAGLRRAARMLYVPLAQKTSALEDISEQWRPFRSVASWYLWQHLDKGK